MFDNTVEFCQQYLDHLKDLLIHVKTDRQIESSGHVTRIDASRGIDLVKAIKATKGKGNTSFTITGWEFELDSEIFCGPRGTTKLVFGGTIAIQNGRLKNQSFAVCITFEPKEQVGEPICSLHACHPINKTECEVVRRFHFDLDFDLEKRDRPLSHLQYGGKFDQSHMQTENTINYRLFKAIDSPRLPIPPYDPVLILDMFLKQCSTRQGGSLRSSKWQSLVKTSEELFLKRYFDAANKHLNKASRTSLYDALCLPIQ
jgi:hypothetical protein